MLGAGKAVGASGNPPIRRYELHVGEGKSAQVTAYLLGEKLVACVSCQVGCSLSCKYCAAGCSDGKTHLSSTQIIAQVRTVENDFSKPVDKVMFTGQGEPLCNWAEVSAAIRVLCGGDSRLQGENRLACPFVDVSTSWAPEFDNLMLPHAGGFSLRVNMNSCNPITRQRIMPASPESLEGIRQSLETWVAMGGGAVSLEFVLLEGVNDSLEEAHCIARFCQGLPCTVDLYRLNEVSGHFKASSWANLFQMATRLRESGLQARVHTFRMLDEGRTWE